MYFRPATIRSTDVPDPVYKVYQQRKKEKYRLERRVRSLREMFRHKKKKAAAKTKRLFCSPCLGADKKKA